MSKSPLNADQMNVVRTKRVSLHRPVAEVIEFLAPLAKFDAQGDSERKKLGCWSGALFVLALVSLFGMGPFGPKFGIVTLALLAVAIVLLVIWTRMKGTDLSDNLRTTALPFLAALREDFGSEPIEVKLDLRPPLSKDKITKIDKSSGVLKDTYTTYTDAWMTGEGTLTDGSTVEWSVVDTILERKRWKKSSSGKMKQKTKLKKKADVDVSVTLKSKRYDVGALPASEVKHGENKNVVRISKKIPQGDASPTPPAEILNVIAGVYRELRPAQ